MTNGPGSCFRLVFIGLLVVLLLASLYGGVITYQVNSLSDFGNETPSPALTLRLAFTGNPSTRTRPSSIPFRTWARDRPPFPAR